MPCPSGWQKPVSAAYLLIDDVLCREGLMQAHGMDPLLGSAEHEGKYAQTPDKAVAPSLMVLGLTLSPVMGGCELQ